VTQRICPDSFNSMHKEEISKKKDVWKAIRNVIHNKTYCSLKAWVNNIAR
jgi:CRISPR/Cas system CMR-associated protein Cmr3 (group 5 of RAMP superfamily)